MDELLDLYRPGRKADSLAELHDLAQPLIEELAEVLGYERVLVAVIDGDGGDIRGAAGVNVPDGMIDALQAPHGDQPSPLAQALHVGKPIRVDDVLHDGRIPSQTREHYLAVGVNAFAVIPVPPASGALVVSRDRPLTEADINELLPYAGRLIAAAAERLGARKLRESGEQYAVEKEWLWWMLNGVQDPVLLSDEQNNVLLYNAQAERLLEASGSDSSGKRRAIELNNVLLSAALSRFRLDQGVTFGRELTLIDPIEGNELLFEVICQQSTNLRTGDSGLVSVLKDVTDLRRANEEVRRSLAKLEEAGEAARRERDRLDLILVNVADPIILTDAVGEIIVMNPPAEALLRSSGATPDEPGATSYLTNMAKLSFFLSQLGLERAQTRTGEIEMVDPTTLEALTMSVTATEVRDARGQVTAVVSVLHDLTQIRELERRRLEQKLFESEKLAAVGRLAAAVAHEINNPLEAIKNALYLVVSQTPEDDPDRRFLEIASKETNRVSAIIGQLLGFYRPTVRKMLTDVNEILDSAIALLERQLRQHHISVRRHFVQDLPYVHASPDQLKQVFLNLLLNAQEAMPDGGTLYVSTRLSDENDREFLAGRYLLIQVRDTGAGIPDEHLPHIFEPFYSTKSESRGTGLGLWVSHGIVQDHGGQIQVRSHLGRGTTFTISLPPEDS